MASPRKTATAVGVFFLVTHVTSIGALAVYGPILNNSDYSALGSDNSVLLGVFLEVILAMANVATAVTLFPVVKRYGEGVALGYVGLRTLEAGIIAVGVIPLLVLVKLRQDAAGAVGAGADSPVPLGDALVSFHNWTFLVGPSLVCGVNTVLMAYLMYRSGLVPPFIAVLGLVGGPLVFASGAAQMFGVYGQISAWTAVAAVPVFAWELSLAVRLITKGFNPVATSDVDSADVPNRSADGQSDAAGQPMPAGKTIAQAGLIH